MRVEALVESNATALPLAPAQAQALLEVGARLAGDRSWWRQTDDEPDRSVIHCAPTVGGMWTVRVVDAVGVIVVDDLQLVIRPKIPLTHFLHLIEIGGCPATR